MIKRITIKRTTRNEADFSDVFHYAKKHFNVEWNAANDLFFHTILDYQRHNNFEAGELEALNNDPEESSDPSMKHAREIMLSFMRSAGVKSLRVYND